MKAAYGNLSTFLEWFGDRLLLDPAGEGEDILNEESTAPYNIGRGKEPTTRELVTKQERTTQCSIRRDSALRFASGSHTMIYVN